MFIFLASKRDHRTHRHHHHYHNHTTISVRYTPEEKKNLPKYLISPRGRRVAVVVVTQPADHSTVHTHTHWSSTDKAVRTAHMVYNSL